MKDTRTINEIDLLDYFNYDDLNQLFKVFPELKPHNPNTYSTNKKLLIDKYIF